MKKYISVLMVSVCLVSVCLLCSSMISGCGKMKPMQEEGGKKQEETEKSQGNQNDEENGEGRETEAVLEFFAMDTFMRVSAYGEKEQAEAAVAAAREEVYRLENLLSTGLATSEIGQANESGGGMVSADTVYLLKRAQQLYGQTMGAFDITVYPLMQAWGFTEKEYRVPDAEEIEKLLEKTDAMQIMVDEENGRVDFGMDGMQIDLGGIAKGYTSARIMEIYKEAGIASGLVSLGGNVQALGTKPDGTLWRIGLQHPDKEGYLGILQVRDKAVITSGGYERYFEQDGVRYHHILDPATGYPARSGLISVTVVSADGALADGLSTSLFIMGKERAVQFWREHADVFDMVLYTEEGELYVTEGISGDFSAEIPVNVIGREP